MGQLKQGLLTALRRGFATFALGLLSSLAFAQTPSTSSFDHNSTGFQLDTTHRRPSCDACHIQGKFKGTPRDCTNCHRDAPTAQKPPPQHVPVNVIGRQIECNACHTTISFAATKFQHGPDQGVTSGSCAVCHNGAFKGQGVSGKPPTHMPTNLPCDSCHKTSGWLPAGYTHALVAPGTCATCHNGTRASGKTASHIPTSASCDACHAPGVAWTPVAVSMPSMHSAMTGPAAPSNCSTCHSGGFLAQNAQVKPATHIATSAQCDTCHTSTSTWATALKPDHDAMAPPATGRCATCHNGTTALGKPSTHVPTTAQCDTCHTNYTAFKPAQMNHIGTDGQCATCHSGSYTFANAKAKPTSHIPTTASCDTCHTGGFVNWSPAKMSHTGTAGKCVTCHSGGFISQNAQTKPPTHIATTAQCDTCHASTTTWATGTFNHAAATPAVTGRCSTCHNSVQALGKPITHVPTAAQCDSCHANFTAFKPATMNHTGLTGQCASCHNGSYLFANAQAKPINHIPTSAQCDSCHTNGFVDWRPAAMNHGGTTGLCSACHSGTYVAQNAQTKPVTHVSTSAQCDTCHRSTVSWATATYAHDASANGQCSSCHNGTTAVGRPTNHVPTTAQCDSCHTGFSSFRPARMNHTGTAGQCTTCHTGAYLFANALAKPANHVPTTGQCDTCHTGGFVAWAPAAMNHNALTTSNCSSCHNGAYLTQNAQTKPATHIPTTAQCDTCHASTVTWATATRAHSAADAGLCTTCHNGTNALGKPTNHIPTTTQCDSCHSYSAAHFAPVSVGTAAMHAAMTGPASTNNCSTCHSGAYTAVNAQKKPATHITTNNQCDSCHKSTTTWLGATYAHDAAATGTCSTCHNGVNALGKNATHIPTSAQCDTCHTNFTSFKPARMNHVGLAAQCSTCHNGSYVAVNALSKPATHVPTGTQCDTCHLNGFANWSPATMNHTGLAGQCSTCHSGAYVSQNAQIKTPTHITTAAQCDTCHNSTTTWATGTFNHTTAVPVVTGRCSQCHNGTNALGKPTNHVPTTTECDTCHNTFTAFAPARMNHFRTAGPVAAGNCATCHSGAYAAVNAQSKPATHIPTTRSCDTCHNWTAWKPTTYSHQGVVAGTCTSCHNGTTALGKPATHVPTAASCDACHTNFNAFAPAKMNHAGTSGPLATGNCSTCHSGAFLAINAQVKPVTHATTTKQCDTCHTSTSTWATAIYTHDATAIGQCSTCHNSVTALGKPTTHIPTSAQCSTCHSNYISFRPAQMNHSGTTGPVATGNCSTCHNGSYVAVNALARPATHIPTSSQCDTCHTRGYVTWSPSTMSHAGLAGQCSTCHSGAYVAQNAQTKTPTHIPTTAQCDTCHSSTTTWATGVFNHATASPAATGRCSQCHNGTNALGKPSNHIPTTAQCDTCHRNYAAFAPAVMSHTGTTGPLATGNCARCHGGAYTAVNAQAKNTTHIPTTQSCDVCHTTSVWKPTSYNHQGVAAGTCATCHNGINAAGKPPGTHIPTNQSCDVCHRMGISWLPVLTPYSHTGIAAGTCTTCHAGNYPNIDFKPGNHLPTTAQCDACHHNFVMWLPANAYNHTGIATGTCRTCHGGTYTGIMIKPSGTGHIPTTTPAGMPGDECSLCHTSTSTFTIERMNHGAVQTLCATCHDRTSPYPGTMQKINRGSHHSAGAKDCSSSGCHKPLGSIGRPYTKWN